MTKMRDLREPIKLEAIKTWREGEPDNLFICFGSPEERCKGATIRLHPSYKAEHIFLLRYSNHESEKREKNIRYMKNKLKNVGKVEEIFVDENKPLPVIREIVEKIEKLVRHATSPKITVDISTPIKWHLLIFLKFLDIRNLLSNVRFLYTEPEDYITSLFQSLSFGIKEIFPIPTFYGDYDFSKEDLLVLILGYEGSRAMALYEEVDPAECLLLVADPPYHEEWKGRTEEMNKEIINIVGASKIRYVDSRNPLKVSFQLREILLNSDYKDYNHIISPLGTKPQTLGLYSYLSSNPSNTILIYGAPLRHNELFYSSGIGRTWELPFEKLKVCMNNEN
jgi:hypothetical protein